ncbi:MAG TPA: hypothetical protein VGG44_07730 [Tepidisphaeraceae bacterium]
MHSRRYLRWLPMLMILAAVPVRAEEPSTQPAVPDSFMRFVDDDHGGGSLQTADVTFRNANGVVVHLVGAIHIAEKSYYDGLNRDFKNYDAVLYELVNTKGAAPPVAGDAEKSTNPISEFQIFLKKFLDLDFQLDDIDYTAPNFVHADMDKDTFEKMQEERGETFEQIMLRQLIRALTNPPTTQPAADEDDGDDDLITVLTRPDGERQMKVVIARQMGQMDLSAMGLDGPNGSVIVTERNKEALKVLADSIAAGKKNMAIFYGAAHMPDMSKRLEAMGFSPVSTRWNLAWDLTIRSNEPSLMEKMMRNLSDSMKSSN